MIETKIGDSIPSKIIRAGKAWHGLVEFVGYSPPRCSIDSMMITTRVGKRFPYPAPESRKGKSFFVSSTSPVACMYMHSSAQMEAENEDGTDWSGYVIAQFSSTDNHELLGLRNSNFLFMTPDGGGQAIPYVIANGGLRFSVYSRINISYPVSLVSSVLSDDFNRVKQPVGVTLDGRSVFFSFVSIRSSILNMYNENSPPENSIINQVDVSGDIIDGVSTVIASSPYEVKSEQYSYTTASDHYYFRSELDYSGGGSVPAIVVVQSDVDPSNPYWLNIVGGYDDESEVFSVSSFPYLDGDGQSQFIRSTRSYISNTAYDGRHTVREAGDGDPPEAVAIISGHTDATTEKSLTLSFDAGAQNICSIVITDDFKQTSEMEMYTRYNLNSVMIKPSRLERETGIISLALDGEVIFSKSDYYWHDDLRNPPIITMSWWPIVPEQELPLAGNLFRYYRALSLDGTRAAQITVQINNYWSSDIFSIAVSIREGDIIPDHPDGIKVAPGTVTQSVHIGKCFARGVILDDPITLAESEFGDRMYRAFDPVDRVITPVYKWPVFFQ